MAEEAKMSTGTMGWSTLNSILGGGALATALGVGIPALVKANNAEDKTEHRHYGRGCGGCSENTLVTRYDMEQSQKIALLEADKYTDQKIIEAYKQSVADNKAIRDEIALVVAKNSADHETIYKELVAQREAQLVTNGNMDKELALLKQADFFQRQLNDCRYYTTKKVVAKDDICPSVMPEFNSFVVPTTTTTGA